MGLSNRILVGAILLHTGISNENIHCNLTFHKKVLGVKMPPPFICQIKDSHGNIAEAISASEGSLMVFKEDRKHPIGLSIRPGLTSISTSDLTIRALGRDKIETDKEILYTEAKLKRRDDYMLLCTDLGCNYQKRIDVISVGFTPSPSPLPVCHPTEKLLLPYYHLQQDHRVICVTTERANTTVFQALSIIDKSPTPFDFLPLIFLSSHSYLPDLIFRYSHPTEYIDEYEDRFFKRPVASFPHNHSTLSFNKHNIYVTQVLVPISRFPTDKSLNIGTSFILHDVEYPGHERYGLLRTPTTIYDMLRVPVPVPSVREEVKSDDTTVDDGIFEEKPLFPENAIPGQDSLPVLDFPLSPQQVASQRSPSLRASQGSPSLRSRSRRKSREASRSPSEEKKESKEDELSRRVGPSNLIPKNWGKDTSHHSSPPSQRTNRFNFPIVFDSPEEKSPSPPSTVTDLIATKQSAQTNTPKDSNESSHPQFSTLRKRISNIQTTPYNNIFFPNNPIVTKVEDAFHNQKAQDEYLEFLLKANFYPNGVAVDQDEQEALKLLANLKYNEKGEPIEEDEKEQPVAADKAKGESTEGDKGKEERKDGEEGEEERIKGENEKKEKMKEEAERQKQETIEKLKGKVDAVIEFIPPEGSEWDKRKESMMDLVGTQKKHKEALYDYRGSGVTDGVSRQEEEEWIGFSEWELQRQREAYEKFQRRAELLKKSKATHKDVVETIKGLEKKAEPVDFGRDNAFYDFNGGVEESKENSPSPSPGQYASSGYHTPTKGTKSRKIVGMTPEELYGIVAALGRGADRRFEQQLEGVEKDEELKEEGGEKGEETGNKVVETAKEVEEESETSEESNGRGERTVGEMERGRRDMLQLVDRKMGLPVQNEFVMFDLGRHTELHEKYQDVFFGSNGIITTRGESHYYLMSEWEVIRDKLRTLFTSDRPTIQPITQPALQLIPQNEQSAHQPAEQTEQTEQPAEQAEQSAEKPAEQPAEQTEQTEQTEEPQTEEVTRAPEVEDSGSEGYGSFGFEEETSGEVYLGSPTGSPRDHFDADALMLEEVIRASLMEQ